MNFAMVIDTQHRRPAEVAAGGFVRRGRRTRPGAQAQPGVPQPRARPHARPAVRPATRLRPARGAALTAEPDHHRRPGRRGDSGQPVRRCRPAAARDQHAAVVLRAARGRDRRQEPPLGRGRDASWRKPSTARCRPARTRWSTTARSGRRWGQAPHKGASTWRTCCTTPSRARRTCSIRIDPKVRADLRSRIKERTCPQHPFAAFWQCSRRSAATGARAGGPGMRSPAHARGRAPRLRLASPRQHRLAACHRLGDREWGLRPHTRTTCPGSTEDFVTAGHHRCRQGGGGACGRRPHSRSPRPRAWHGRC